MIEQKNAQLERITVEQMEEIKKTQIEVIKENVETNTTSSSSEFSEYDDEYEWNDDEDEDPSYVNVEEEEDWNEEQFNSIRPIFKKECKDDKELSGYSDYKKE
jgi:hypothetical protein